MSCRTCFSRGDKGAKSSKRLIIVVGLTLGILWGRGQDRTLGRSRPTPVAPPKWEIPWLRDPILAWWEVALGYTCHTHEM